MARARNIKPGFFLNDQLAAVPALGRLLFIGLWCLADREGRLEDRPARIKAETLCYDDCDVDSLLNALNDAGFIERYTVASNRYIQVVNFNRHQNPHIKEPVSEIPAPCKNSARTGKAPGKNSSRRADSGFRIPDSGFPHPCPAGVAMETWAAWLKHRGKMSAESAKRQAAKLEKLRESGHDPNAVVLQSIERGWSGLFELPKEARGPPGKETVTQLRARVADEMYGNLLRDREKTDAPRDITGESERVA